MSTGKRSEMATSFGRAAGSYEAGRPGYPAAVVRWMLQPAVAASTGRVRVADVGAGTGKLTRTLLGADAGAPIDVLAIDPDARMLEALAASIPGVPTAVGTAERLPLADGSVDAIVLGQAWHWVDPEAGAVEIARVLRPGGVLGLVWNIRDAQVPWVARMTEIMHRSNAEALLEQGGPRVPAPFIGLERVSVAWSRPMTADALMEMARSRSYLITAPADERARIETELRAFVDALPELRDGGAIELPYRTHAFRTVRP